MYYLKTFLPSAGTGIHLHPTPNPPQNFKHPPQTIDQTHSACTVIYCTVLVYFAITCK